LMTGACWSFLRDSPAAIVQACKRSVRRWRLKRVLRVLPGLEPQQCDVGPETCSEGTIVVDFADTLSALLRHTTHVPEVPEWRSRMRADLASSISGGQWSQTRRAAVERWHIDDTRCQLCFEAPGTLEHRFDCRCLRPEQGWSKPPPKARLGRGRLTESRTRVLDTRGLLVLQLPKPPPSHEGTFEWLLPLSGDDLHNCIWYLDGSLLDGAWSDYSSTGFGIVVVSARRDLVAYGCGRPPSWCCTAAAAEAWALCTALSCCPFVPHLRTDCQSLLLTAAGGAQQATSANRPLARVWGMIASALDGDTTSMVEHKQLVWMPAHQPLSAVGHKELSNGKLLTVVDWRANRLVDALAKLAATRGQAPKAIVRLLESGKAAMRHAAALLGVVTHGANHHEVPVQRPDGTWGVKTVRDAQQAPSDGSDRRPRRAPLSLVPPQPPAQLGRLAIAPTISSRLRAEHQHSGAAKAAKRKRAEEAASTKRRVDEIGASAAAPDAEPSAQQRMSALRARVCERERLGCGR
jgi:hypothetical protein